MVQGRLIVGFVSVVLNRREGVGVGKSNRTLVYQIDTYVNSNRSRIRPFLVT